jgi:hypothetical protein
MFYLFFQMYVVSVFIWMLHMFHHMLQMFYLDDAYVCNGFSSVFRCFCKCLRRMLQMFQLFQTMLQVFACRCCKIRSSIAHVAITMRPTCRSRQLLGCRRAGADVRTGEAEGVQVVPCGVRRCDVQVVWAPALGVWNEVQPVRCTLALPK